MPPCTPAAERGCRRCSIGRRGRDFRPKPARSFASWKATIACRAPDFVVGTSEPCQQGERVLADLVRDAGLHGPLPSLAHADPSKRPIGREHRGRTGGLGRPPGAVAGHEDGSGTAEGGLRAIERGPRDRHSLQPSAGHKSPLAPRQRGHPVCEHVLATVGQAGVGGVAADLARRAVGGQEVGGTARSASTIRIGSFGFICRRSTAAG